MKHDINDQSKNDIQELLEEYIVTPVNKTISRKTDGLQQDSEALLKELQNLKANLQYDLQDVFRLLGELGESFEEKFEDLNSKVTDSAKAINSKLADSEQNICTALETKLDSLKEKLADSRSAIEAISEALVKISTQITDFSEPTEKKIEKMEVVSSF